MRDSALDGQVRAEGCLQRRSGRGLAQAPDLVFERGDALVALGKRRGDIGGSKRSGMCCGQFASQAATVNTIACSARAL